MAPFSGAMFHVSPFFIAVDPHNPNLVFEGYGSLYRSTDGGMTWENTTVDATTGAPDNTHGDMRAMTFSPLGGKVFLGSDGGVFSTTAPSARRIAWTNLNNNLSTAQLYPGISIHPMSPLLGFAGSQDNGTAGATPGTPAAHPWAGLTCGDGGRTLIDPANPSFVYTVCLDGNPPAYPGGAVQRSDMFGLPGTFTSRMTGIDATEFHSWIPPLAMDPRVPKRLYYGRDRIYQTITRGSIWRSISPRLGGLTAIAVAPSDGSFVYAGMNDGAISATSDALAAAPSWATVSSGLPPRYVTDIVVDPASPRTVYATFNGISGFGSDTAGHVFRTATGGSPWTDISGDLPNIAVNGLIIEPDAPNTLYAATDIGVFSTRNGGVNWTLLGTGLPRAVVTGLAFQRSSRTLRAGTFGRGAWDLVVPVPVR
jgi:photosystem II stability/assembly factor-like uncharacterized protein